MPFNEPVDPLACDKSASVDCERFLIFFPPFAPYPSASLPSPTIAPPTTAPLPLKGEGGEWGGAMCVGEGGGVRVGECGE
jgi:hypothetical protein